MTTKKKTTPPEGTHIVELLIENIMKVRVAHIKPKGSVVQITGKNGQGKTSVLRAIAWALTGTSDIPTRPVRAGQKSGMVKMDLGDLVVTRYFTAIDAEKSAKGEAYTTRLLVEGKRREQFRTPQTVLDALMGKISFDPLAFLRMDDKKQLETLRSLVQFDIDIDALDAEQETTYQARRERGREVDSAKSRLGSMEKPAADLPTEPIDTAALTEKISTATAHNDRVGGQRKEKADKLYLVERKEQLILERVSEIDKLKARILEIERAVQDESESIHRLRNEAGAIAIDEEIETAELMARLTDATETNARIASATRYRQVEEELRQSSVAWQNLDKSFTDRAKEREQAMARAKMPIEGLSIGRGEVLYQGLPLGQASNAEQIRVSMALAMASNPKLRVLRISDGSLLDSDSMELIAEAAEKHGFQVWMERVDSTGKVGVVMEDGTASGDEVVASSRGGAQA